MQRWGEGGGCSWGRSFSLIFFPKPPKKTDLGSFLLFLNRYAKKKNKVESHPLSKTKIKGGAGKGGEGK